MPIYFPFGLTPLVESEIDFSRYLPFTRAAAAGMRLGLNDMYFGYFGDSKTLGTGVTSAPQNAVLQSYPGQLMQAFRNAGIPANINSVWGNINFAQSVQRPSFDDRYAPTGGWPGGFTSLFSLGGNLLTAPNSASGAASFTPREAVNAFDVYTPQDTIWGTSTIDVDGGSPTTINQNGAKNLIKTTINAPNFGIHTLNVKATVTGVPSFAGIIGRNTSQKQAYFHNFGISFATSAQVSGTNGGYLTLDAIKKLGCCCLVIDIGTNDALQVLSLASFETNLRAIVAAQQTVGDAIIVGTAPFIVSSGSLALQKSYVDVAARVAATMGCLFVSNFELYGSYEYNAVTNNFGYYADGIHFVAKGYGDEMEQFAKLLIPLVRGTTTGTQISLPAAATASVTLANSGVETSLVPTLSGSKNLGSNYFTPGKTIRIKGGGIYSADVVPGNFTLNIKYGAVVIAAAVITTLLSSASNLGFQFDVTITCRTTGATGTVITDGNVDFGIGTQIRGFADLNNGAAPATIDTTAASAFDVTGTWATASAANTITIDSLTIAAVN